MSKEKRYVVSAGLCLMDVVQTVNFQEKTVLQVNCISKSLALMG
jgi:hypothetical protein